MIHNDHGERYDGMDLLTVDETARMLKVSPVTVRRFIARGQLTSVKVGRQRRVEREAVESFVRAEAHPADDVPEELRNARPLTLDDPLFGLVGIAKSDGPSDVSSNKHKYLAEALDKADGADRLVSVLRIG
jgi:excisionase family DNA binding protein